MVLSELWVQVEGPELVPGLSESGSSEGTLCPHGPIELWVKLRGPSDNLPTLS